MRTYKRKGPRQWSDKDKRMNLAVRMRAEGKSLREIAVELAVSHQTVSNDLARWDERQAKAVPSNVIALSTKTSNSTVKNDPQAGRDLTPGFDAPTTTGEALGLTPGEERIARAVAFLTERGA